MILKTRILNTKHKFLFYILKSQLAFPLTDVIVKEKVGGICTPGTYIAECTVDYTQYSAV